MNGAVVAQAAFVDLAALKAPERCVKSKPKGRRQMQIRFKPDIEERLSQLVLKSGRAADDLVEDALVSYLAELSELRDRLDGRYDDVRTGRVTPLDGETFFEDLRKREEAKQRQ